MWATQVYELLTKLGTDGGLTLIGGADTAETLTLQANRTDTTGILTLSSARASLSNTNGPALQDEASSITNPTLVPDKAQASTGVGSTTNVVALVANGKTGLTVNTATNAVNYVAVTPAAASSDPLIAPAGSDDNIDLKLTGKGTGGVIVNAGNPLLGITKYTPTINPAEVAANTSAEETFAVSGLTTADVPIALIKPTLTAGLSIGNVRVSLADTLAVTFVNSTAAPIDPGSEVYTLVVMRF